MENVLDLNHANFEKEVASGVTLVDFWAEWCGPCRMMLPNLAQFALESAGKVKVAKVNVDQNMDLAQRFHIMGIPALIVFKDGQIVKQVAGVHDVDQLIELTDSCL